MSNDNIDLVILKIKELIPIAPRNWATLIGKRMNRSESTVREYARGVKGRRLQVGGPIEVLQHLKDLIEEKENAIKKCIR